MTNRFLAECLVLLNVLAGSARFLFIRHTKNDSLAATPYAGLFFALVNIGIFGISVEELAVLVLAFWACLWNLRSLLRLSSGVITDRYEIKLVVMNILNIVLTGFVFWGLVITRPMSADARKMQVVEDARYVTGNFREGVEDLEGNFKFRRGRIIHVEPEAANPAGRTIVVFVPPKTANAENYRFFFYKLAKNGYSVYSGDFYTGDALWFGPARDLRIFRRFTALVEKMRDRDAYDEMLKKNRYWTAAEYDFLVKMAHPTELDTVFLVGEEDAGGAMEICLRENKAVSGSFDLNFVEGYATKGFGPVENTDLVTAWILDAEMDRSGYVSSHLGSAVTEFISSQIVMGD